MTRLARLGEEPLREALDVLAREQPDALALQAGDQVPRRDGMMRAMNLVDRFHHFLACYALKDLAGISPMLTEGVTLRDWDISVQGRAAVEQATSANFAAARSIDIEVLAVYEKADAVAGELRIVVDGEIELHVVDVIQFDAQGQVTAIRSYKGRAD